MTLKYTHLSSNPQIHSSQPTLKYLSSAKAFQPFQMSLKYTTLHQLSSALNCLSSKQNENKHSFQYRLSRYTSQPNQAFAKHTQKKLSSVFQMHTILKVFPHTDVTSSIVNICFKQHMSICVCCKRLYNTWNTQEQTL